MYYYPIVPFMGRASGATRHKKKTPDRVYRPGWVGQATAMIGKTLAKHIDGSPCIKFLLQALQNLLSDIGTEDSTELLPVFRLRILEKAQELCREQP
jgi:hypothetical protein